jgi:thymidylate synthase (FAD)
MITYIYEDNIGSVELIDHMGNDKSAVNAARVSFLKDTKEKGLTSRDKNLIKFLVGHNHTSPFEHMQATFRITVPLFVRSQVMRHRTFSYNEVSRRYTAENIQTWKPQVFRVQSKHNLQCSEGATNDQDSCSSIYDYAIAQAVTMYNQLLNNGVAREQARAVLPQATYTTFYMTGSIHNWVKFLKLRLDEHTQLETQLMAAAIKDELVKLYPVTMKAMIDG